MKPIDHDRIARYGVRPPTQSTAHPGLLHRATRIADRLKSSTRHLPTHLGAERVARFTTGRPERTE